MLDICILKRFLYYCTNSENQLSLHGLSITFNLAQFRGSGNPDKIVTTGIILDFLKIHSIILLDRFTRCIGRINRRIVNSIHYLAAGSDNLLFE